MKCSICGQEMSHPHIKNYLGNNPFPVRTGELDRCCDACNDKYVIYYRIGLLGSPQELADEASKFLNKCSKKALDTFIEIDEFVTEI